MGGYVEPTRARHRVQRTGGVEQLRIPARRSWFVILFLPFWLVGWAFGEMFAAGEIVKHFSLFLAAWLGGWTIGGALAVLTLLDQLGGAEIVRVEQGDLVIRAGVGPIRWTRRYRGGEIRNLMGWYAEDDAWWGPHRYQTPLLGRQRTGSVRFDYGARSVFLAGGVDAPEGAEIADWLAARLPRSATAAE